MSLLQKKHCLKRSANSTPSPFPVPSRCNHTREHQPLNQKFIASHAMKEGCLLPDASSQQGPVGSEHRREAAATAAVPLKSQLHIPLKLLNHHRNIAQGRPGTKQSSVTAASVRRNHYNKFQSHFNFQMSKAITS